MTRLSSSTGSSRPCIVARFAHVAGIAFLAIPLSLWPALPLGRSLPIAHTVSFSTGLESGDQRPDWTDVVDATGGGLRNVGGLCCGLRGPEAGVRTSGPDVVTHAGNAALVYSGSVTTTHGRHYTRTLRSARTPRYLTGSTPRAMPSTAMCSAGVLTAPAWPST